MGSEGKGWQPLPEKTCGVAICSFRGTEVIPPHGIDIDLGDVVFIDGELEGWYHGHVRTRRNVVGVFPSNYIKLKPPPAAAAPVTASSSTIPRVSVSPEGGQRDSAQLQTTPEDPVAEEITEVVREWDEVWKRIFAESGSSAYQFEVVQRGMQDLIDGRKQLITGTLTQDQLRELKLRLTRKIDWGNRRLGLDLVPRIGFEKANPDELGAVELYNVHVRSVENADAIRGSGTMRKKRRPLRPANRRTLSYHLLLSVRDFAYPLNDDCEIYFSLWDGVRGQFITERFMVKYKRDGMSNFVDKLQCQGLTVFEDLGAKDLSSKELYLVVQVVRIGRMFYSESSSSKKSNHFYKRPFGGGVLNIGDVVNPNLAKVNGLDSCGDEGEPDTFTAPVDPLGSSYLDQDQDRELTFKLYSCDEKDFWQLHELLVRRHTSKVSPVSGGGGASPPSVVVTLKLLSGDLQHIRIENPVLFNSKAIIQASASSLCITKKLGFPDVIMPGDVRNDMYLTLEAGEFEKSGKTTGKNIEVTVLVLDMSVSLEGTAGGRGFVPPASYIHISNGTGLVDEYASVILYHANCPKWHETIRLSVPIERFPSTHVRIEYRHCSTKEKNDKKLFGFSYVRLMDEEGTTLKDGAHELYVYKCEDKAKLRDPRTYLGLPSFNINTNLVSAAAGGASKDSLPVSSSSSSSNSKDRDSGIGSKDSHSHRDSSSSIGSGGGASGSAVMGNHLFQRSAKEVLNISTLLVSTKLTQNMDLVSLLKWKAAAPDKVREILMNVAHLSGEEVVKFLQDVLDVLFAMFLSEEGESNDNSGNVFIVLVNIFSMLEDAKFEHFKPVIDQYIQNHFAAALVYKGLLTSVCHYARVLHTAPRLSHGQIQRCFETLEYTFKFIIQSHALFTRASGGEVNDSLVRDVQDVFGGLTEMLRPCEKCRTGALAPDDPNPCPGLLTHDAAHDHVPIKSAALYNLHRMYNQLVGSRVGVGVMSPLQITQLLATLFDAIPLRDSIDPLSPAKLTALHHLVRSPLFADRDSRRLILPEICKHLRHHLGLREELKLCTDVLGDILTFMYARRLEEAYVHDDIEVVAVATLENLVQSILVLERRSAIVGNLVACMVGLLQLMSRFHYNRLWDGFDERASLKELLSKVFYVFRDLVRQDVYPTEWFTMKLCTDSIILQALAELSQPLVVHFLNKYCIDLDLWRQFFTLATTFLTQPGLQLERFREGKGDIVRGRYGDMRVRMGDQILAMWAELGEHKAAFLPELVGPFLEITLVPQQELRHATLGLFFDMLQTEQAKYGSFKQVESELIDRLDAALVAEGKGDDEYRLLFNRILMQKIEEQQDPELPWKQAGMAFVQAVTRLLERLLDHRSCNPQIAGAADENRDKRMSTTVNLLNFYHAEANRREMYLRYIYRLHDLHLSAENYVEAGFTLLLHSRMLSWNPEGSGGLLLPPEYGYPTQTELQRKECIVRKVIGYFDAGKLWEAGIPLCKELAEIYETQLLEYAKLSELLRTQATFFENILQQLRPEPEYFRVGFYGRGFPPFVRNKEFVYRGLEYERLSAFVQRLLAEWPSAEVMNKMTPPEDTVLNSSGGKFLQICSVRPRPSTSMKHAALFSNSALHGRHIAEPILSYYNVNNVTTFQYDRRITKDKDKEAPGGADAENEFKHMWIERTTLTTAAPLPGILRWFEVVHRHVEELTPVRFACEKMDDVNRQLAALVAQYTAEPGRNVNPLSMRLQGMLDAAVMGGLPKYRDAFFTPEFLDGADAEVLGHVGHLYAAILEQINVLEQALALHGRLAPAGVQPLHKRLLECFAQMKATAQKDFNVSPATKCKFGVKGQTPGPEVGIGARDSFRKTSGGSSIVYTPLPPVPRQSQGQGGPIVTAITRKHGSLDHSSLSLSNRSSTSSSGYGCGYGHLVGSIFDDHQEQVQAQPPPITASAPAPGPGYVNRPLQHANPDDDDDDEDFYAKPDESKVNQLLQPQQLHDVDGSMPTPSPASGGPPPIPDRSTKRQFPGRATAVVTVTNSNASTISMTSSNSNSNSNNNAEGATVTKHTSALPAPTEYILMPPSRMRELSAAAEATANSTVNSRAVSDKFCAPISGAIVTNESYFVIDATCQAQQLHSGPPLPPKSTAGTGTGETTAASAPPQLPKRVPKNLDGGKSPLTPKSSLGLPNSFATSTSRSSTPPASLQAPPTPTKTPPPVPPKPRSNSINSITGAISGTVDAPPGPGIEDYEFLPPACTTPTSPSYEERFDQTSGSGGGVLPAAPAATAASNGVVKMRERETNANSNSNEGATSKSSSAPEANGNLTPQQQRISSTSTCSSGSGSGAGGAGVGDRRRAPMTNKEYYELPDRNKATNNANAANYVNNVNANTNTKAGTNANSNSAANQDPASPNEATPTTPSTEP